MRRSLCIVTKIPGFIKPLGIPGFNNVHRMQKRWISGRNEKKYNTNMKPINRNTIYDPHVKEVIKLLDQVEKDQTDKTYDKIMRYVKKNRIDINSYDTGENIPLAHAAKHGQVDNVRFLINVMGANVHASYDCPYHKTALHYAAEKGHREIVEILLKTMTHPNVLDSGNCTALDYTKDKKIRQLLESHGCIEGKLVVVRQILNLPRTKYQYRLKE